jgi:hypothetical protein
VRFHVDLVAREGPPVARVAATWGPSMVVPLVTSI